LRLRAIEGDENSYWPIHLITNRPPDAIRPTAVEPVQGFRYDAGSGDVMAGDATDFSGFAFSMPADTKPEFAPEVELCSTGQAESMSSAADADTSVSATSGTTAHRRK
jgi:hypothetical protein